MLERLTDQARHGVTGAETEARALKHDYLGTEHLLLGLLTDTDDVPTQALKRHQIDLHAVRNDVREIIGERDGAQQEALPHTPRVQTVLELAERAAEELGHEQVDSGHLLLALVREGEGVAPAIMRNRGADLDEVQRDVLRLVREQR